MAEIASLLLSPFLQVFFERMASGEFLEIFRGRKLNEGLLHKLKISLLSMSALHEDAEEIQLTNPAVKAWLDELKDAVYDAEDILDEIATELLQRKSDAEFQTTTSKCQLPNLNYHSMCFLLIAAMQEKGAYYLACGSDVFISTHLKSSDKISRQQTDPSCNG